MSFICYEKVGDYHDGKVYVEDVKFWIQKGHTVSVDECIFRDEVVKIIDYYKYYSLKEYNDEYLVVSMKMKDCDELVSKRLVLFLMGMMNDVLDELSKK